MLAFLWSGREEKHRKTRSRKVVNFFIGNRIDLLKVIFAFFPFTVRTAVLNRPLV